MSTTEPVSVRAFVLGIACCAFVIGLAQVLGHVEGWGEVPLGAVGLGLFAWGMK